MSLSKRRREEAQRAAVRAVVVGMVADGDFDPTGLSPEEVESKCLELFAKSQPSRVLSCVDHSHDLAQHARRFHDQGYFEIAVLLYATACEHWVNDVVSKLCRR